MSRSEDSPNEPRVSGGLYPSSEELWDPRADSANNKEKDPFDERPKGEWRSLYPRPLHRVIAQELVYRTFFFHRYGPLFGSQVAVAVAVNGVLFGYAHIVMGNVFAVWSTALVGMLLAARYVATRSIWAVWLEHSLWGWLVFTVGLGHWFFTGAGN